MHRTDAHSQTPSPPASRERAKPWRRLFTILAVLIALTATSGFLVTHLLARRLGNAVDSHAASLHGVRVIEDIEALCFRVNAPANDIFRSNDVDAERTRMRSAADELPRRFAELHREQLGISDFRVSRELSTVYANVRPIAERIVHEAEEVFHCFERGDMASAAKHMAAADEALSKTDKILSLADEAIDARHQQMLETQVLATRKAMVIQYLVAGLLLLLTVATVVQCLRLAAAYDDQHEALRQNQERQAAILNLAINPIIATDASGRIIEFNPAAERTFGHRRSDVIGQSAVDLLACTPVSPNRPPWCWWSATGSASAADGTCSETELRRSDGSRMPVEIAAAEAHQLGATMYIAWLRDLTALKNADEAIAERMRLLALTADLGVALVRDDSTQPMLQAAAEALVRHLGAAFARIWTLEPGDSVLHLRASAGLYTHLDGPHARIPVGAFKIGRIAGNRKPHLTNSVQDDPQIGDRDWARREGMVAFAGHPLICRDQVVGVLGLFAKHALPPVTMDAMKAVADELAVGIMRCTAQQELNRAAALLRATPDFIATADVNGRYCFVNDALRRFRGLPPDVDSSAISLETFHAPDETKRIMEERTPIADAEGTWSGETLFLRADGVEVPTWQVIVTHRNRDGHPEFRSCIARDLTDRKRMEAELVSHQQSLQRMVEEKSDELLEAQARLMRKEKLASVGELAAGVAHEINTPIQFVGDNLQALTEAFGAMTSLVGEYRNLVDLVRSGTAAPASADSVAEAERRHDLEYLLEDTPKALSQGMEGVQRVAHIVRAMKDFSHADQGEAVRADVNHILSTTLTLCRNEYKYIADVTTDLGQLPMIECFGPELSQVFLNIVVNAAHAIQSMQRRGTIHVRTRPADDGIAVEISDDGCGIAAGVRSRIFDPFFTTKEPGHGTGLGLSLAHQVVVGMHGGRIDVESEPGRGTTFHVFVPSTPRTSGVAEPKGINK